MNELTFAERDRLEADRQAKRRECVERLAKVLAREFSLNELKLIQNDRGDAIRIEAYEIARTRTRR
jgi:hypothetical protein